MIVTVTPNPCVDKTVFVDHLTPGEFIRSEKCTCIPGGKGTNVSRAVKALGCDTKAVLVVGGHPGAHVVDMVRNQDRVECVPAWVASQTRTITTVLEQPIHRQTAFFEPGSRVTQTEARAFVDGFSSMIDGARVVSFNGTVSDRGISWLYRELIPIAKAAGVVCLLDSHGPEFALGLEAVPYMVKPNVSETEELLGRKLETMESRWDAIDRFHEKGVELVVLSMGKHGALVSSRAGRFHAIPPEIEEVNPVGSGDALLAGFAVGLLEGIPMDDAARLAIAAGTANAMSWDIGHFTKREVDDLLTRVEIREA